MKYPPTGIQPQLFDLSSDPHEKDRYATVVTAIPAGQINGPATKVTEIEIKHAVVVESTHGGNPIHRTCYQELAIRLRSSVSDGVFRSITDVRDNQIGA